MAGVLKYSINGEILDPGEAFLPLPDDGFIRGDGVFEVVRIYSGRPFGLDLHLDRMEKSGKAIELEFDRSVLLTEAEHLVASGADDCVIRLIVTRGGNRVLSLEPMPTHGETITLATVTYSPTVILDGVKSLSYAANMQATRIAQAAGAVEALLVKPDGIVLEAPTSSIFWATSEGELRTPSISTGILDSITRRKIIERTEVIEGEFHLDDLMAASEVFIASTTREAHPVSRIDSQTFDTNPAPQTKRAAAAFAEALAAG